MRHLVVFFAVGALLLGGKRLLGPWLFPPALNVEVDAHAGAAEVEHAIDEAILLEQALARGGAPFDPVVREQLTRAMQAPDLPPPQAQQPRAELPRLERALVDSLQRSDPMLRRRLAFQSEQLLMARADAEQPSEAALEGYAQAHAARYASAARFSLQQVMVSRDMHGTDLSRAAEALRARLPAGAVDARSLGQLGDSSLLPSVLLKSSARELEGRFGPGFATHLEAAPLDAWIGPLASAYGLHFVRLTERTPGHLPPLAQIRARVLGDYRHDRRRDVLRERLRALRAQYRVEVRRQPS